MFILSTQGYLERKKVSNIFSYTYMFCIEITMSLVWGSKTLSAMLFSAGTAAVAVAGILASLKITKKPLKDNVFVFQGAGEVMYGERERENEN